AVPARDAPLLVVVFVVEGIVVPSAPVRFDDRSRRRKGKVISIGRAIPLARKLAHEVRHAVCNEKAASLHLERRPLGYVGSSSPRRRRIVDMPGRPALAKRSR